MLSAMEGSMFWREAVVPEASSRLGCPALRSADLARAEGCPRPGPSVHQRGGAPHSQAQGPHFASVLRADPRVPGASGQDPEYLGKLPLGPDI